MDGARADEGRRLAAAGRGRARLDQHDHRRLLRRRAVADRDRRPRACADDGRHRPGRRRRDADRGRRRAARRAVHRHPHQDRAERPVVRRQRPAWRRAAAGAGAQLDLRLRRHDAMGRASSPRRCRRRRSCCRTSSWASRAPSSTSRPRAGRPRDGSRSPRTRPTTSATATRPAASRRWPSPARPAACTRPTAWSTPKAASPAASARPPPAARQARAQAAAFTTTAARWADVEGEGDAAVITFGSATGPVREAIAARRGTRHGGAPRSRCACSRRCSTRRSTAALDGVRRVMVVEQNHGASSALPARHGGPAGQPASFHRPGPLPLRPGELCEAIRRMGRPRRAQEEIA